MDSITTSQVLIVSGALISTMFGLLATVLGWIGNKLYGKLDDMSKSMRSIEVDLHGKISDLDRRVTRLETKID